MEKYEDVIEYTNYALKVHPKNKKCLYKKAKALRFLFQFDECDMIFRGLKLPKELEITKYMKQNLNLIINMYDPKYEEM